MSKLPKTFGDITLKQFKDICLDSYTCDNCILKSMCKQLNEDHSPEDWEVGDEIPPRDLEGWEFIFEKWRK